MYKKRGRQGEEERTRGGEDESRREEERTRAEEMRRTMRGRRDRRKMRRMKRLKCEVYRQHRVWMLSSVFKHFGDVK